MKSGVYAGRQDGVVLVGAWGHPPSPIRIKVIADFVADRPVEVLIMEVLEEDILAATLVIVALDARQTPARRVPEHREMGAMESSRSLVHAIAEKPSLRRDFYWGKMAVRELQGARGRILDIATGTGDGAIGIIQQNGYQKKVFGLDFSEPMIRRAQQKILRKGLFQSIALSRGDAIDLPFRENTFSASIIAFGLRNIPNKEQALFEMIRVIKKGGKVIILEFTFPRDKLMRRLYPFYFKKFLPWVGGLIPVKKGPMLTSLNRSPNSLMQKIMRRC